MHFVFVSVVGGHVQIIHMDLIQDYGGVLISYQQQLKFSLYLMYEAMYFKII